MGSDFPYNILGMECHHPNCYSPTMIFRRGWRAQPPTSDAMTWMRTSTPMETQFDQPRPGRTGLALVPAGHWAILGHSREARIFLRSIYGIYGIYLGKL